MAGNKFYTDQPKAGIYLLTETLVQGMHRAMYSCYICVCSSPQKVAGQTSGLDDSPGALTRSKEVGTSFSFSHIQSLSTLPL